MHPAPAVSFSANRSRWHLRCILVLFVSAAVAIGAFALGQPQSGWQVAAVACTLLSSAFVALFGWYQSPRGSLRWNGQHWHWSGYADHLVCVVSVRMDLQSSLLASLQCQGKPTDWLWFDAASDPTSWRAFRRAVFFSQSDFSEDDDAQSSAPRGEAT
jgi:hypothetical protein